MANALGLLGCLLLTPIETQAYVEQGRLNDAASWHNEEFKLNWGLAAVGADHAYARGLSGNGVRVGIFDSGVNLHHSEFAGKAPLSLVTAAPGCTSDVVLGNGAGCFFSEGNKPQINYQNILAQELDFITELLASSEIEPEEKTELQALLDTAGPHYSTHGTHVAGTMVANRDGSGMHGLAYGAELSTMRPASNTFSPSLLEDGTLLTRPPAGTLAGVYARLRAKGVRAVNNSWGMATAEFTTEEVDEFLANHYLSDALTQGSRDFGLLQVWAAGNTTTANLTPRDAPIASLEATLPHLTPELEPYWLSVVDLNHDLSLSDESRRCGLSKDWCLAAPGTDITSSIVVGKIDAELNVDAKGEVNGFRVTAERPTFGYGTLSGTSMAAPHVTGGLALLMERYPYLDNPQIRDVLLTTATDLGASGVDDVYGWGLMNLEKAIDGPGQLRVDTDVNMDRYAGGAKVWEGGAWDDWRNDIDGPGRLGKSGVGWLRLSGENRFAGATLTQGILELNGLNRLSSDVKVGGGAFILNGTLQNTVLNVNGGVAQVNGSQVGARTTVGAKGTLTGTGLLADTRVEGTIMPGTDRQALRVNGDYRQATGSTLVALAHGTPEQWALRVAGHAQVDGGTLRMARQDGVFPLGQRYHILHANSGLNGGFSTVDHNAFSPFLSFNQVLDANAVRVDVGRGRTLASAANTPNQLAVASAADREAMSGALPQRLTALFPEQAPHALDQLSGELHASSQAVLIENSRILRDAALDRARSTAVTRSRTPGEPRSGVWVQLPRYSGTSGGDGNTARTSNTTAGVLAGIDHELEQGTRLGVVLGSGRTDVKAGSRGKANIDTYQIGLHVGHTWDAFGLYGGAAYAQHEIQTKRQVNFPGINERLSADYSARTLQVFTEANYRFDQGAWDWQPYVQLAQVRQRSDGFSEHGGVSALKGLRAKETVNLTTSGVRFNVDLNKAHIGPSWLSLLGGVAYTLANGDVQPATQAAWDGGSNLQVTGAPLNRQTTRLELGAIARLTRDSSLDLGFSQQWGERFRDQNITAQYSLQF
ncbi:autotransporter domain-containing protein [Pseudomonas sp. 1152_12]|uniref:autotransporter domain-containing protein n=1 Tax=Pseudomonas sp. 1152_12 TaxID=2604455 RepID=UPI004062FCE4